MEIADRVVVMNQGRIEQVGTPAEIYDHPATPFVYQFLGNVNALPCRIRQGRAEIGTLTLPAPSYAGVADAAGVAFVRPHDLMLFRPGEGGGAPALVRYVTVMGPTVRVELAFGDKGIEAELTRERYAQLGLAPGQRVLISPRQARFFLREGWQGTSFVPEPESAEPAKPRRRR